ncbi:hypothetical protein OUZ56_021519 [Daphnia magna]|uniref:Uncharacterized protein n=1 Tax=Daphnia magna TaxID=35525 RepID=A0ABQ9ZHL2_9CRUS|nr:hypothetical protein OUZ56_021519 [Daphnia magna]
MIWKDEPDFLDVRVEKQAEKFVQETADELKTFPPPLETNLQSEFEQIPCEKETPTKNFMTPPPTTPPNPSLMISSPTISLPSNPITETSTLPIQPERRLDYVFYLSSSYHFSVASMLLTSLFAIVRLLNQKNSKNSLAMTVIIK